MPPKRSKSQRPNIIEEVELQQPRDVSPGSELAHQLENAYMFDEAPRQPLFPQPQPVLPQAHNIPQRPQQMPQPHYVPARPQAAPRIPAPVQRGGFFCSLTGVRPTATKNNQALRDSMRKDPNFLQNAGAKITANMSADELRDELEKCRDYAKTLTMQQKERAKIDKQIADVVARITSYLELLPPTLVNDEFARGIVENLGRREHESPVQHLARIKVVEAPIKKMTQKQESQGFEQFAEQSEARSLVEEFARMNEMNEFEQ
jgi:hypothetical protein